MKVNNQDLSSLTGAAAARAKEAAQPTPSSRPGVVPPGSLQEDDVHLSELVRSLRALAIDSPERQAHIDKLTRAYANGSYQVDAQQVAGKLIDDAIAR